MTLAFKGLFNSKMSTGKVGETFDWTDEAMERQSAIMWLGILSALLLAGTGVLLGRFFSRLRNPYWAFGYFIPLAAIVLFAAVKKWPALAVTSPLPWLFLGRNKFAVFALVTAMVLTTPLSRLPRKRDRTLIFVLMANIILAQSIVPFVSPLFNRTELSRLTTRIHSDGVCRQSNDYTCGAAAAVTALRKLGFSAEEGEIAILAQTSFISGTDADILATALNQRYGPQGLIAEYRVFKNIEELKAAGMTLAVVRFNFFVDHFVTVLEVTNDSVIVGDPLNGRVTLSHDEFAKEWRLVGVVLHRRNENSRESQN